MNAWQATVTALCIVTGTVFDAQHHRLPSTKVYLQAAGKKEALAAQTDSAGVYHFSVPAGFYTLHAEGEPSIAPFMVDRNTTIDLNLQPPFFDEPQFTIAGVTDNTYRGGHGSDTVLRSAETLAKATAALGKPNEGNPLDAVRAYQKAAELDPTESNLFDWGSELLGHRASDAAAEVFKKGTRLFPLSIRMMLGLASAYYAAGQYAEAGHCFFAATDLAPNDADPYLFLAKVQAPEITQLSEYQDRMARFAKLQPNNALANYYYALTLPDSEARPLLNKATKLDPRLALAHLQLGILESRVPRYSEAINEYQKAIALDPQCEEAHYRLSEAYRATGDQAKAKEELATFHELSKASAERTERERREIQRFVIELKVQPPQ